MNENIGSVAPGTRHAEAYTAPAPQAAEDEVADFLHGVIRLVHPDNVLETGTYLADTTVKLAQAVAVNGHGMVTSVEVDHDKVKAARTRLIRTRLAKHVRLLSGSYDSVNLRPEAGKYQVAFFDSHWERDLEFKAAQPFLAKGCVVVFHDCGPQHKHGEVRARVQRLEDQHLIRAFYIPTPRGVVVGVVA